jgi:hypothetical protein
MIIIEELEEVTRRNESRSRTKGGEYPRDCPSIPTRPEQIDYLQVTRFPTIIYQISKEEKDNKLHGP